MCLFGSINCCQERKSYNIPACHPFSFQGFFLWVFFSQKKIVFETQGSAIRKPVTFPPPHQITWLSMRQQDCFVNSWISSNSCNLLLPAEISAGKWDFFTLNTRPPPLPLLPQPSRPPCLCAGSLRGRNEISVQVDAALMHLFLLEEFVFLLLLMHKCLCMQQHARLSLPPRSATFNCFPFHLSLWSLLFKFSICNNSLSHIVWITCVIAFQENSPTEH